MPVIPFRNHHPRIAPGVFVAPNAWVTGDVSIAADSSVFFGATIRGDILPITVGKGTNIQDHSMLHTSTDLMPCVIGDFVTIGHGAIVHGCTVEDHALIGMSATVLDGAVIGKHSIVGANALVPMNMKVPERSLVLGVPGKIVRQVTEEELQISEHGVQHYIETGAEYFNFFSTYACKEGAPKSTDPS